MTRSPLSRRAFLRNSGASAALIPLLSADWAHAAAAPKRLVMLCWPNGVPRESFWPTGTESDFTLSEILSPLEPYKKDMLIVGGCDLKSFIGMKRIEDGGVSADGWGHDDYVALLTGVKYAKYGLGYSNAGADSIDQFIGKELAKSNAFPFPFLSLGTRTDGGWNGSLSFAKDSRGSTPETNPNKLFEKLFAGRALPGSAFDAKTAERKSILDYLGKSVEAFGKRMGSEDNRRIESHLQSVRGLERQLSGSASAGCSAPTAPMTMDWKKDANYPALVKAQTDLLVSALKCDLTRVATVTYTNTGGSDLVFSWLGAEYTGAGDEYPIRNHHDIAHQAGNSPAHLKRYVGVNKWYVEQVRYLVDQLATTTDVDGKRMLDNTAVVMFNNTGGNHGVKGIPFVVIGSCGGYFKTGRFLRYGGWVGKTGKYWENEGVPHNGFLVALCNAMDCPVTSYGDPQYGGELPGVRG